MMVGAAVATAIFLGPAASAALAYIDPGTGGAFFSSLGMILGVTTAFLAVALTQVRRFGGWIFTRISARKKTKPDNADRVEDLCT